MSDDIPIGTGGVETYHGPVPKTIKEAFNLWFKECGVKMFQSDDPVKIESAKAAMFAVYLAGLGWALHVSPSVSVSEYLYYKEKFASAADSEDEDSHAE